MSYLRVIALRSRIDRQPLSVVLVNNGICGQPPVAARVSVAMVMSNVSPAATTSTSSADKATEMPGAPPKTNSHHQAQEAPRTRRDQISVGEAICGAVARAARREAA